ncbi:MAG: hypothetical protein RLZZ273_1893 [Bacteroidota bacterium]|jgi:lipoyl(octanoyl) transferase
MNVEDWGLIDFDDAWRRQRELSDAILHQDHPDTLVFCQHPPVITLGRNTQQGSVLASAELLGSMGVDVIEINRGGEATIHNPGQLVGYPIFNLQRTNPDLHWFLRTIEQCIIDALAELDLASGRVEALTGVWVNQQRKICAIGIHCSRWITSHGFALNVDNDLDLFSSIVPCGITERGVTSIAAELRKPVSLEIVQDAVLRQFLAKFSQNTPSR